VWNEPVIWNAAIDTEIENAESQVVLRLAEPAAQIALHDPLEGVSAVETAQEAAEFTFTLDDHPVFIKIR
jgi:hypothetical protein